MIKRALIGVFAFFFLVASAYATENVSFKSTGKTKDGKQLILTGHLSKPEGNGPFPAIVVLHGCAGILKNHEDWAKRLKGWGYVVLLVDSLTPRGETTTCEDTSKVSPVERAEDAYDAKSYISRLKYVDQKRIALMGWSHGAWTTLFAIDSTEKIRKSPFQAAIAFYPFCGTEMDNLNAPLLILTGKLDDWTPSDYCQHSMPSKKTKHEIILKIYPDAYHAFDNKQDPIDRLGHHMEYNPKATEDAIIQTKSFLEKYLK